MAKKVKYIKIPANLFESETIRALDTTTILLYLHLLCSAYRNSREGIFEIANVPLTDELMANVFTVDNIGDRLKVLEDSGLIIREKTRIKVIKFWISNHNRNSAEYRKWRTAVFMRDGFRCQLCGTNKDLQAHHIEAWKDNAARRYDVTNGVTLCKNCHLIAHGGRWR